MSRWMLIFVLALSGVAVPVQAADNAAPFLEITRGFYMWCLDNFDALKKLEPKIVDVPASNRLMLDPTASGPYAGYFVQSGFFHPKYFPRNVRNYYNRVSDDLKEIDDEEYARMRREGREVLMETEDMDPLMCAQDYEYEKEFVEEMQLSHVSVTGNRAVAVVLSPYDWETTFTFKREGNRWLITGFCVFQQQED